MHNRIRNRAQALLGILRGNLKYQKLGFIVYPSFGLPISDLDTCRALNLGYDFPRADLLESLSHAPFTIYTMVSYMLSNTHIIDRFLDKMKLKLMISFLMCVKYNQLLLTPYQKWSPSESSTLGSNPFWTAP